MIADKNVEVISAREGLGKIMLFTPENSAANIKLGYCDGLRFTDNLCGINYYIRPVDAEAFNAKLMSLDDKVVRKAGEMMGLPGTNTKRMLFEKIIPKLGAYMKLGRDYDYADFIIALLEYTAEQRNVEQYQVYDFEQLRAQVSKTAISDKEKKLMEKTPINQLLTKKRNAVMLLSRHLLDI
jgi:hypothetical protein